MIGLVFHITSEDMSATIGHKCNGTLVSVQPRPQGLLLDDFQNGGSTGATGATEDPSKGWNHVVQNLQKSWRFLSRDILRKAKTKWRRRGSKTPVKGRFNFGHEAAVAS